MIIVLFFVRLPPLDWLGDIIIVLLSFYYRFIIVTERVRFFSLRVAVFNVLRGGVRFPNEVGVW